MSEKDQSPVNWLMEERPFSPPSSGNNINIPAVNHFSGSSFSTENHVLGNPATSENHLAFQNHPGPQTRDCQYTPTAGKNQTDVFSSQAGLQNQHLNNRLVHQNPGFSGMTHDQIILKRRQMIAYTSLDQVRGRVSEVAKEQINCRFLQENLVKEKPEDIDMIFSEVKDNLHDMMMHPSSNYLIRRLIDVANEEQLYEILVSVIGNEERLKDACVDPHGSRVVQQLLHYMQPDQQYLIISALSRITVELAKSDNGNHVIKKCMADFAPEVNKPLLDEVAANCLEIAVNKSGCCILQNCVDYAVDNSPETGETRDRLLAEIAANAQLLSEDLYGNYVVQHLIDIDTIGPGILQDVLTRLRGKYVSLSMNKHGSNVVEKCLKKSKSEQCISMIISELLNSPHFLDVLQDPYGSYVAQSALEVSTGRTHIDLVRLVLMHEKSLHNHPHGKRLLQQARACL